MAESSLGKNFPKMIPSLLRVFNGWYLQGLVIWCVSLSRPQNLLVKTTAHRQTRRWYFIEGCPNLNFCSVAGCPKLISGMPETHKRCPNLTNKFSYWCKGIKGKLPVGYHLKICIHRKSCGDLWMPFPTSFKCMPWILWPRFVVYNRKGESSVCTLLPKHLDQMNDTAHMKIEFRE